jgi:hypothetical protein
VTRVAGDRIADIRALTVRVDARERELAELTETHVPQLLALPGCGHWAHPPHHLPADTCIALTTGDPDRRRISVKVDGYVLGNVFRLLIAGGGTLIWLLIFRVPYSIVLAIMVAIFDLIPIVGSTVGGIVVTFVALTVSLPVAITTAIF